MMGVAGVMPVGRGADAPREKSNVTATLIGLFATPGAEIEMLPLYTVPSVSRAVLTETLRLAGVVPLDGVTCIQGESAKAEIVGAPFVLVMRRVCAGGGALIASKAKARVDLSELINGRSTS